MKIFSATVYDARTTISHTTTAMIGTLIDARDAEQLAGRGDARELGDRHRAVGDQQHDHGEGRPVDAELFADQLGEAFAGDDAHARHLDLDDDQRHGDRPHHPEQAVAVLGADRGVGGDAASVVAGGAGDQARPEKRQHRAEGAEASPVARPHRLLVPVDRQARE